jgi:hypothetical protein
MSMLNKTLVFTYSKQPNSKQRTLPVDKAQAHQPVLLSGMNNRIISSSSPLYVKHMSPHDIIHSPKKGCSACGS